MWVPIESATLLSSYSRRQVLAMRALSVVRPSRTPILAEPVPLVRERMVTGWSTIVPRPRIIWLGLVSVCRVNSDSYSLEKYYDTF